MLCPWRKRKIRIEEPDDKGVKEEEHFMECYEDECPLFYGYYKCARAEKNKDKR